MAEPLVILDRDGVINRDSAEFVKTPEEWLPLPGSIEAIAALSRAGVRVCVITNQSGIGRGLFDHDTLRAINDRMQSLVREQGGEIHRIEFCPHHPDDNCECRKPRPGMFLSLAKELGVALAGVPAVGDSLRDLQAARAAGARPVLVLTGNGERTRRSLERAGDDVETYANLGAFAEAYVRELSQD